MVVYLNIDNLFAAIRHIAYVTDVCMLIILIFMIPKRTRICAQILEVSCASMMLSMYMSKLYVQVHINESYVCLLYTSPSPRDRG